MIKTHFKRQGSAGLLILQGIPKSYYAEYDYNHGYLKLTEHWEIPKKWNNKIYYESHCKTILYKNYLKSNTGTENFIDIQNSINEVISQNYQIEIENYIESYYVGAKPGDRDMVDNIDITDNTVQQVMIKCRINLIEFFQPWKCETMNKLMVNPSKELLNKKFSELYSTVHWYGIKSHENHINEFLKAI